MAVAVEVLLTLGKVPDFVRTFTVCVCVYVCLQEMSVGYANGIRVMSMTHTGEPGFMLYIPIEVNSHLHTQKYASC